MRIFGKPKLVDVKAKPEDPEDWQWVYLLLDGGPMLCEAEVSNLAALPDSFRVRKIMEVEEIEDPKGWEARTAVGLELQAKFEERQKANEEKVGQRSMLLGVGKQNVEKLKDSLDADLKAYKQELVAEGKKMIAALPKLPPIDSPKMQVMVRFTEPEGFVRGASVSAIWPLTEDMAKRCDARWAKFIAGPEAEPAPTGPATVYDEKPLPDAKPMTPEMAAVAQGGLARIASSMAHSLPKAEG